MNREHPSDATPAKTDLRTLNGRVVLVKSSRDHRTPPTAMRGWIEVREKTEAVPAIAVVVEFPPMFTSAAHHRTFPLDGAAIGRLLRSESNGAFEFTIDDELR